MATSTPARRRSYSAPTTSTRRRATVPSPRRRTARRRSPPAPLPAPVSTRRRTSSIDGNTYTTSRRREPTGSTSSTVGRRRTAPATAYGYSDRPSVMSNFGDKMPSKTNYGYSGSNAFSSGSKTNVAMYAAGGVAAGAVMGAGAYYAYNEMYNNDIGFHRRRRVASHYRDTRWCTVTATGSSRYGAFMECQQCYDLYGYSYCPSSSSCQTASGCGYTAPTNFNRDDLAATGFVPASYTSPLKVTFTTISGAGIDTDPVSGICPPTTAAQASLVDTFNKTWAVTPDLFLVLTEQAVLRSGSNCDRDTTTTCSSSSSCWIEHSTCESGSCKCDSGYCFNGQTCAATAIGASSPVAVWCPLVMAVITFFALRG